MADPSFHDLLSLVDLSAISSVVLSWTRLFAAGFSASTEVLHVLWPEGAADDEIRVLEVRGELEKLSADAFGGALPYRITVMRGHPVKEIFRRIEKRPPECIVMGSHGYDGMARVLLGSVAENVVRFARCPMLIVKGPELAPDRRQLERVLCPVNLTDFARHTTEVASAVADRFGAELLVVQVVEQALAGPEGAEKRLREWLPESVCQRTTLATALIYGEAAERIVDQARRRPTDLIVLGAEHRPFLEFTTLGRTTERVMRYCPCSVLLLPR